MNINLFCYVLFCYTLCGIMRPVSTEPERCKQNVFLTVGGKTTTPKCKCSKLTKAPNDYKERIAGDYYKYHSEAKTWFEAWTICEQEGGHLAVLRDAKQAKYVGALGGSAYGWAFIGFHDMFQEGKFITLCDETLEEAGYNQWPSTDPNGGTGENCGVIFPNGLLGDYKCGNPCTFMCQIQIC